jgi:Flp pilus assembly protein TadD
MAHRSRKEQIQEMLKDEPNDLFLLYGLAMAYVSEGADEEAVARFRQLLELHPEYVPAYMQGGQALVRLRRVEEARRLYENGIAAARAGGDQHAAEEMQGFLDSLG